MRMRVLGLLFILVVAMVIHLGAEDSMQEVIDVIEKRVEPEIYETHKAESINVEVCELPPIHNLSCVTYVGAEPVKAWDDIPLDYETQVAMYDKCEELGISFWFMLALLESESNYKANAVGDKGKSIGYMQINKCNWERMKTKYNLDVNEPIENIYCGCVMVKELMDKYDTLAEVIMGYKCGESRMRKLIKNGTILKSVDKVTNRAIELENAHREE